MEQGTGQKQKKQEQNPAVRRWLDNLRKYQETIYIAEENLERLGYSGKFLTYQERAGILQATLNAVIADDRGDQADPMDRVWLITAILSYEKSRQRTLGWPKELLAETNSKGEK